MTYCAAFAKLMRGLRWAVVLLLMSWPVLGMGQAAGSTDMEFWEDLAFWETIKDSQNPEEFALYIELYPQGRFVQLARIRLQALTGGGTATPQAAISTTPIPTGVNGFRDCPECPLMVTISAGRFMMGSAQRADEQPVREVQIANDFGLGVYPVTVGEWRHCVAANACRLPVNPELADDLPMHGVSWYDTQQYIDWLNAHTGGGYRLPTEAEWEYAARAGTSTDFWWGNELGSGLANCQGCGSPWDNQQPAPVGSFAANPWGLHDIHGNIWEWTADCWRDHYRNAPSDGRAYTERQCVDGVQRGGAYRLEAEYMRTSRRFRYDRDVRFVLNGFRVAKTL